MNRRKASFLSGTALLAALYIGSGAVWGTILIPPDLTGQVTSTGVDAVTINGHQYFVKQGSQAATALASLAPGQVVDVYLDGPATSSASQVVGIKPHGDKAGK
jgi:hypothetical protein